MAVYLEQTKPGSLPKFVEFALTWKEDTCLIWPYGKNSKGYGIIKINGKSLPVHRVVLERFIGPSPEPKMDAAHAPDICHNRACVNPLHLRWATRKENMADKSIDGTDFLGERHPNAKLHKLLVIDIFNSSGSYSEIAQKFGISKSTVSHIKTGIKWSHVTGVK